MKIKELVLTHFRCFTHLQVTFEKDLTVIVAPNGAGKTAILEGLAVALGAYLTALPQTRGINFKTTDFEVFDNQQSAKQMMVKATTFDEISWDRKKTSQSLDTLNDKASPSNGAATGEKQLRNYVSQMIQTNDPATIRFPVVAYYSTSRFSANTSAQIPYTQQKVEWFEGYRNALDVKINFNQLVLQMASFEDLKRRERERLQSFDYNSIALMAVKQVLGIMLPDITNLRTKIDKQIILIADFNDGKTTKTLNISQLSAGYQALLAVVLDITFRLIILNREHSDCLEGEGIVMIDEIDLHLHPKWQQQFISKLQQAFINIQFIVTTHSPQVLSTVKKSAIRVLGHNSKGEDIASMPLANSYGEPSNDVLQAIMAVDPQPPVPEKADLQRLTALVDQGYYANTEALDLLNQLKQQLSPQHPQIARIERSIRRQKVLQG